MEIKRLKLKSFRNYESLDISFGSHINILYGDNAQGKSNLLEAIYVCASSRSYRGCHDRDMIRNGDDFGHIGMELFDDPSKIEIDIHLKKNDRKGIAVNKIPIKKVSELIGTVKLIIFSPEDLSLIKGGPSGRRNYLNMEISQLIPLYLSDYAKYKQALMQRNQLLKDIKNKPDLEKTLDIWDEQIIKYGCGIIIERTRFIKQLNEVFSDTHSFLTEKKEKAEIKYQPSMTAADLLNNFKRYRDRDLYMMSTTAGPHRDDFTILINGMDVRQYGSQGQKKTAALALKLSEIDLIKKKKAEPILLLDDVFSELDRKRQTELMKMIGEYQTFITCTKPDELLKQFSDISRYYLIKKGTAQESGGF